MTEPEFIPEQKKRSYFFRTLLGGLLVALPIIILIAAVVFLVRFVIKLITPIAAFLTPGSEGAYWWLQILAFIIVCALFFMIGLFVNTRFGKSAFNAFENTILKPIPFYSSISSIVQQFNSNEKRPFRDVVLCDPFKSGALMTGFIVEEIDDEIVVVYVPTAPNPTNGFVFHMKREELTITKAKTEDAMASVIGMGAGSKKIFGAKVYEKAKEN